MSFRPRFVLLIIQIVNHAGLKEGNKKMVKLIAPLLLLGMAADVKYVKLIDKVNVGGTNILVLRGRDASDRVNVIYDRLPELLTVGLKSEDVTLEKSNVGNLVKVNGKLLVTLRSVDAKQNKSSLETYSANVLKHLKEVLPEVSPAK